MQIEKITPRELVVNRLAQADERQLCEAVRRVNGTLQQTTSLPIRLSPDELGPTANVRNAVIVRLKAAGYGVEQEANADGSGPVTYLIK